MAEYYDALETRDPTVRETEQFAVLGPILARAVKTMPGWAAHLEGCDVSAVGNRQALAALPVLRKPELMEQQAAEPPFGGFAAPLTDGGRRVFMSPGPVFEPEGRGPDPWRAARALFAAGFRAGDIVHNTFSYHLTPGAAMLEEGAFALGCTVFPAGPANTDQQVEAAAALRPNAFCGTPDFLKILLDKASELGRPLDCFEKALVSGGALFPSLRQEFANRGVSVCQAYGTADAGIIAYESPGHEGMIIDEGVILEIVRPGTDQTVPDGEVGEIVVSVLSEDYPLLRFGTGDLSAILEGRSPCGRTGLRIKGWMGRADQRIKVKGMFIDPKQVAAVLARHDGVSKARLEVTREAERDRMVLKVEGEPETGLAERLAQTLADETKISGSVEIVPAGSLPNDGKVISDERDYGN